MRRTLRILTVTTMLVMPTWGTALAGAVPVVTFDAVPTEFEAGTPHTVSFSILAHGKEPIDAGPTSLRFQGPDGETVAFDALYDGEGGYTVEVTLPSGGRWQWAVATGEHILQDLGTISVAVADGTAGLLATLRVGLPIATFLAVILLIGQLIPARRLEGLPLQVTDVV